MPNKYELITTLYRETLNEVSNPAEWQKFLHTAGYNFRLDFDDLILLYAQKPESTAVLEIEKWNKVFGRWVNKGSTGIAFFDKEKPGSRKLRYFFDISDTHEARFARPVPTWKVLPEFEETITETLENAFGELEDKSEFGYALLSAAKNAVEDNMSDYLERLEYYKENSFLEDLDELNLKVTFRKALQNSIGYMLLSRCGVDTERYFTDDDFRCVMNFSTVQTLNVLGTATGDISQMCLDSISKTVLNLQKQAKKENRTFALNRTNEYPMVDTKRDERRNENGNHIQRGTGIQHPEPSSDSGTELSPWEIRVTPPQLSQESQKDGLHQPSDYRGTEQPSGGDSENSRKESSRDYETDEEGSGSDRGTERERPDEMGGSNEQHQSLGGRDSDDGTDSELTEELPPFLNEEQIMAIIKNKDDDLKYKKSQIELFFNANHDFNERCEYIKSAYPIRYTEIIHEGQRIGYVAQENGLLMWEGPYLSRTKESVFSWGVVAEWVANIIDKKEYFINTNITPPKDVTVQQMSLFDFSGEQKPLKAETFENRIFEREALPQQIIDEALCIGANDRDSKLIICSYFKKDKPIEVNAEFLKKHYGRNGAGFFVGSSRYSFWYDENGMRIAGGESAKKSYATEITWEQAAKRIRELLDLGRYIPQEELDKVDDFEYRTLADTLCFAVRDFSEEADERGYCKFVKLALSGRTSFPNASKMIEAALKNPDMLQNLINEWEEFVTAYEKEPELMRFRHYKPKDILSKLKDLQREPHIFTAAEGYDPKRRFFISEDEIEKLLRGGEYSSDYRIRVYNFFAEHKDSKERENMFKQIHGEYSGYHGGNDNITYQMGKGVSFSHGSILTPYAKIDMKWNEVVKRVAKLISDDKWLTEADRETMESRDEVIPEPVKLILEEPPEKESLASRLVGYMKEFDPFGYADTLEIGETDEDAIKNIDEQLTDNARRKFFAEDLRLFLDDMDPESEKATELELFIEELEEGIDEPAPEEPQTEPFEHGAQNENEPAEKEETSVLIPPKPKVKAERIEFYPLHPEIPKEERHNFRITDNELGYGTMMEKYFANVKAIIILHKIEDENRFATPEEQQILSRYVGWGGLAECFEESFPRYEELKSLLTPEEYEAARASSLTAFYTHPEITGAMYSALYQMGFRNGNILEPSCGVGNFIGSLPESMADSKIYGVELDSISGRIAQQLYQNSNIAVTGFEKVNIPDSFFDVAIGNVPFGDFKVLDKRYDKHHFLIHDYFFAKALDKVRPGGVVAFITSKGTMDKENPSVRKYLAQRADLIGAIRLPNNAFKKNAGTEVTADILFLQKRDRMVDIEPDWIHLDTDENGIKMNSYFVKNPDMILGEMQMVSSRFGMESTCKPYENAELSELLRGAVSNLHAEITEYEVDEIEEEDKFIPADPNIRNFSYAIIDGKIYFRENSRMHQVEVSVTAENRIRGMIALRESVRKLIECQTEDYPEEDIKAEQENLNKLYDDYTKKYGLISSRGNSMAFGEDSSYYLLCSLEILDEEGNFKRKADMFSKRTIRPHVAVTSVDTASEALAVSISEKARVDMEYMSGLSDKTDDELESELKGVIFRDIHCSERAEDISEAMTDLSRYPFVTADEYLSGNVRRKLRMAKAMYEALPAEKKDSFQHYVSALEAVQPVDLTAGEIGVRIGVNWIPTEIYEKFMYELLGTGYYARTRMKILRSRATGEWNITNKSADAGNIRAITTYGTKRINAYHILEQTLNQKDVRIYDKTIDENGNEKQVLNKRETAIAQDRQELIKAKFVEWLWKDIDRRERLCSIYNETFNALRPREYDGEHIRFSGMNPEITLRSHQINAIAHIMYGGNTLLAHEVGAGKTFEMVAAAMESKRLGLCSKSLVVVPNHITEQWASEWLQLYPSANILVATKKDFETRNRKKFCARIATGDYDAVIIGHSQFEKIPMSKERQETIIRHQIEDIVDGIREAKAARAERYTVKQLEKTKKSLETRLAKLNDQSRKDDVVTFEELGVDRIFVDESHYFKNLFLATKMRNVGGIAQTEAQKSSDLFMKCQYLDEITGGRGVVFATGTPISNSMVELYTIQRYLQYDTLQEMDMLNFDDWAANYGETITAIELSPEGTGYRSKTRFAKFYNLPELMSTFKAVADIQTADMLKLPVPKANFHTEVIKPSELQKEMIAGLAERAEIIRNGGIDPSVDNMLKITNDGRKLALDMRLINPLAADDENGKVSICAKNIFEIWEKTKENKSAQMVFCDLSTPKDDGSFNVYDDLKKKLMEKGIPVEEIAFIHDANTETRKKELFAKVRSGQVRVIMGSTQKMGAGTNCQDRLIALHDLDCPWRPSDLAQRLGRIVRQGNQNPEVEIFRYVTENTFDAYLYQLVENKQKFIAQIMTSKAPARVADDVDETALSYSEIKALATGNPLIIEKCNLDMEVGKLNMLKANHLSQKYALEEMVYRKYPAAIQKLTERIAGYEKDIELAKCHQKPEEGFVGMIIFEKLYTDKESAGKAIIEACTTMTGSDAVHLGKYRGFDMTLSYDATNNEYRMTLKGTLSHTTVLGADIFGNITRVDNLIDGMAQKLEVEKLALSETQTQLENARTEMETPFAKETELKEKSERLKELNILLNMDQKDRALLDEGKEEETPIKEKNRELER